MANPDTTQRGIQMEVESPGEADVQPGSDDDETPDGASPDVDGPPDESVTEDDDDDDAEDPLEGADSPQERQRVPDTASELERVTNALSKAAKAYGKRVADIFGQDWLGCVPCPLCSTDFPGVLTPVQRSEEVIAAVRPIIGLPDVTNYPADPTARRCDVCDGTTRTLTGSRDPRYLTKQCKRCRGTGFIDSDPAGESSLYANGAEVYTGPTHEDPPVAPAMPQASIDALEKMLDAARNAGAAS